MLFRCPRDCGAAERRGLRYSCNMFSRLHTHAIKLQRGWLLSPFIALALGLALLFGATSLGRSEMPGVRQYTEAEFLVSAREVLPPGNEQGWQSIALPDTWWSRRVLGTSGWYRLSVEARQVPESLQGVYLFRLNMNAAIYFNGVLLGNGGNMGEPLTRNWNRPLYFNIPQSLWRSGQNELLINLVTYPGFGMFPPVLVGPDASLRPAYQQRQFLQNELSQSFTALLVLVGLFFMGLWLLRRHDTAYFWFALSSFCWAAFNTHLFARDPPIQGGLFLWFAHASLDFWMVFLVVFMHRHLGIVRPRLEQLLFAVQAGLALIFIRPMTSYDPDFFTHASTTHALTFAAAIYLMVVAWRHWKHHPSRHSFGLATVFTLFVIAGLHDWVMENPIPGLIPLDVLIEMWSKQFHLLFFMAPVLILFVAWQLAHRFIGALNETEQLNCELEQRVAAAQRELEASFAARRTLELAQAATGERERIYRDLHDDVGAKLLGLAISAQRANLPREADLARSALQDLRDVVSRSAQACTPLGDLLADWRVEAEQRVNAAGLILEWGFPEGDTVMTVSAESALNLSRILREAVTNVLRHADAGHIWVDTQLRQEQLVLIISDDGKGCPPELVKQHRGMTGMRSRAEALGAIVRWESAETGGCRVRLEVPLCNLPPKHGDENVQAFAIIPSHENRADS